MVSGELHVSGKVRDGKAVAFFLLDLGDVRTAILLFVQYPAEELFEDYMQGRVDEGHRLNRVARQSKRCCEVVLTKYVGFDGQ